MRTFFGDNTLKIYCDSACETCHGSRSKDTFIHRHDYLFHCRTCRSSFICTPRRQIAGASGIGLSAVFACPACTSALVKISMTRATELGVRTAPSVATTPASPPSQLGRVMPPYSETWFRSYPQYLSTEIRRNVSRYIDELAKVPNLTSAVLLDFLSHVDIRGFNVSNYVSEILTSLSVTHPEVVRALYDALVTYQDEGKAAMEMRLALQKDNLFDLVFCKTNVPAEISGTIDLWGVNPNGDITWFTVVPGSVEENAAQGWINELMSINPFYYANVKRIILVANRFVWTVKQTIAKYGAIQTQTGTTIVELLEENPPGQFVLVSEPKSD